jgi:nucleoside-diphosphate-sugar epimerase
VIFLVGGEGFVGSGFARELQRAGAPFEIITRANYQDFVGRSCDLLINANGNSSKPLGRTDPKGEFRASVLSVRDSLVDFRFGTYVFLSTSDVYPDSSSIETTDEGSEIDVSRQSPYGFHKYLAEQCVRHAAPKWLLIRQGGFVGPGLKKNAVFDVLRGEKLWVHPDTRFQYIHTDDSARCCLALLERGAVNDVYNLTAEGTISVGEVMELAGRSLPAPDDTVPTSFEISTAKAAACIDLPTTEDCVRRFLAEDASIV